MHTYFLGDEEVRAYVADFAERLVGLAEGAPRRWITLGVSGDKIAAVLLEFVTGTSAAPTSISRLAFDRTGREIRDRDPDRSNDEQAHEPAVVIDGAVHSGASMAALVRHLNSQGCHQTLTYSLVVKLTSAFIPSYFGLLIGEHDRAFFQLSRIPNNRLLRTPPFGSVRMIEPADVHRAPDTLTTGVASIDRVSFGDLLYSVKTQGSTVYLFEVAGEVAGYLHFKHSADRRMLIDLIANSVAFRGKGVGGVLMRWAETYARATKLGRIELWAIKDRIGFYESRGFKEVGDTMDLGGGEIYALMRRRLLYNLKPEDIES